MFYLKGKEFMEFKTWKIITLGTGPKSAYGFRMAIKKAKMFIGESGDFILGNLAFRVHCKKKKVELVNVSLNELGFENGAACADIFRRAQELGLDLCPAEVGPQLRLQYKDQPKNEWLLIAMEPLHDSSDNLNVFVVERCEDGDRWLDSGNSFFVWDSDERIVFLRHKKVNLRTKR